MPDYKKPTTITQAADNPRYQGKIVIESPEGLFSTTQEERAVAQMKKLTKKYPDEPPVTTVLPKGVLLPMPVKKI